MIVKRYIPNTSMSFGRGKVFVEHHHRHDGTVGYTEEEVSELSKKQLQSFRVLEIEMPEEATAVPGQRRSIAR